MQTLKSISAILQKTLEMLKFPENYYNLLLNFIAPNSHQIYDTLLSKKQIAKLNYVLYRLKQNTPPEYIVGYAEFFSRKFKVNKCTHIPKPLTEDLVATALFNITQNPIYKPLTSIKYYKSKSFSFNTCSHVNIFDFGTGSGNIIITLALELIKSFGIKYIKNNFSFYATEVSECTLNIAKQNAKQYKVEQLIQFRSADFPKETFVESVSRKGCVMVVTNPPYISNIDYSALTQDVKTQPLHSLIDKFDLNSHITNFISTLKQHSVPFFVLNEAFMFSKTQLYQQS